MATLIVPENRICRPMVSMDRFTFMRHADTGNEPASRQSVTVRHCCQLCTFDYCYLTYESSYHIYIYIYIFIHDTCNGLGSRLGGLSWNAA
mmetsp:Transcript_6574/g.16841  ORF Transcript_6574/g.16841 Transcript_6574/m.16841 type:complete len:91 (+) Transcript_6574:462-734(+)